jgi:hypothetical protein
VASRLAPFRRLDAVRLFRIRLGFFLGLDCVL